MIAITAALWLTLAGPQRTELHPLDAEVPPRPPPSSGLEFRAREVGTGTTMYVNFDGIDLGECNPGNSKKNCTWYNFDEDIPAFSGTLQTQVSVMQAIRRDVADFGVRVTGLRPPGDQNYVMVVYGGTEAKYGALGSAPSGDCLDQNPNEVAFAHLDGATATWVNGGATTALHEAAHTWGLDHVDLEGDVMYPASDNGPTAFADGCNPVVADADLTLGGVGCPEVNADLCGDEAQQNARPLLTMLFGPAYVDVTRPTIALAELEDGQYFQRPATFDVVLDVDDDLHPQTYEMWAWLADDPRPEQPATVLAPGFAVDDLPVGSWTFHVVVADEAGHESEQLDFTIEVGLDPPPVPEHDGGCRIAMAPVPAGLVALVVVGPLLLARPRRRR